MSPQIVFEELGDAEKTLLLQAYDYNVDPQGFILNKAGNRIKSDEIPDEYLSLKNVALVSGSLTLIQATPSSISRLIRKQGENHVNSN
ncbi:hypothetical protein J4419_05030 [Candidatus Woesearchaeota archaeon]|nr:hypothetical protein [Candidatus Woesearchaeota archaeon]